MEETMIKPSSPTKPHPLNYTLCLFDQFIPPQYVPLVLFYSADQVADCNVSEKLKNSLSKALSDYYPFAGRLLRGNYYVECNDDGALFVEARVQSSLSEFLENPDILHISHFLPFYPFKYAMNSDKEVVLGAKLSVFECGGFGIGICLSHKVADGQSMVTFLKSWSETSLNMGCCSTLNVTTTPRFDASAVFQPKESFDPPIPIDLSNNEKVVSKMFRFDGKQMSLLKSDALFRNVNPSRVEAVTALIWEALTKAKSRPSVAVHMVSIRARMDPPLPDHAIGNLFQYSVARNLSGSAVELGDLVEILRKSISSINSDYMSSFRGEGGFSHACNSISEALELAGPECGMDVYTFSSWTRFPFYEADFGWGKPTWVATNAVPTKNTVILMGTRLGDGIEAWVTLAEDEMAEFETNPKLLQFLQPLAS